MNSNLVNMPEQPHLDGEIVGTMAADAFATRGLAG